MEGQNVEVTETTPEVNVNESVGTQAPETDTKVEAGAAEGVADKSGDPSGEADKTKAGDPASPPTFKPRDKYKVRIDDGVPGSEKQLEERDIPAWLKTALKDPETEKQAIELLEQAGGLEWAKKNREDIRKERDTVKAEMTTWRRQISDVRDTYRRGDLDGFFDKLDIPHEKVMEWAVAKAQYSQLPPEQQKILDERTEAQRTAHAAQTEAQTLQEQIQEQMRHARQQMLDMGLARPEVKTFADAFDSKLGRPGAFLKEVIMTGRQAHETSKVDLSPQQAIEQTMQKWGAFLTPAQAATPAAGATTQEPGSAQAAQVIPNVQGGSKSPMKPRVKTLDDLKKLSASFGN